MQLLPHEVADVQPVLDLLSRQDPKDPEVNVTFMNLLLCLGHERAQWIGIIISSAISKYV